MSRITNDDEVRIFPTLRMPSPTSSDENVSAFRELHSNRSCRLPMVESSTTLRTRRKRTAFLETRTFLTSLKLDCSSPASSKRTIPSISLVEKPKLLSIIDIGKSPDCIDAQPDFDNNSEYTKKRHSKEHGPSQFTIYRYATLSSTEEFENYRKSNVAGWTAIAVVIRELEDYLRGQGVMLAVIDGDRVREVSMLYSLTGTFQEDLISCIVSIQSELPISSLDEGNERYPLSEYCAASMIQRVARRHIKSKRCSYKILQTKMAILIQNQVRRLLACRRVGIMMDGEKKHVQDRWITNVGKLKSSWRSSKLSDLLISSSHPNDNDNVSVSLGNTANRQQLYTSARLVICIPSTSSTERIRLLTDRHQAIQNMHIACMYQLADPHVHVIYISPINLSKDEVIRYETQASVEWDHQFTGGNRRFHVIVPELLDKLPSHLPISLVLLCSFLALRRIKTCMSQFLDAVIVSSSFSWPEKCLSHHLNVPLLGPDPTVASTVISRSFARQIFRDAGADVPIGAQDIYTSANFLVALSTLIVSNLEIKKWIFRLNNDLNNEQCAYLNVAGLSVTASLRAEMAAMLKTAGNVSGSWHSKETQLEARKKMLRCLRDEISSKAIVCRREYYKSWEQYEKTFCALGMMIEAEPIDATGSVLGLLFIEPFGSVQIVGGVDLLMDRHYQVQGYLGPMTLADDQFLRSVMEAVSKCLYAEHDVIGYVAVEFRTSRDPSEPLPRLTPIGIKLGLSPAFMGIAAAVVGTERSLYTLPRSLIPCADRDNHVPKSFVYLPYVHHNALSVCRDDAFMRICKTNGVAFDSKIKTGTMIFRLAGMGGGSISTLSVAACREEAVATAMHSLQSIMNGIKSTDREKSGNKAWDSLASILSNLGTLCKHDKINNCR
jgi:hypothetical protein